MAEHKMVDIGESCGECGSDSFSELNGIISCDLCGWEVYDPSIAWCDSSSKCRGGLQCEEPILCPRCNGSGSLLLEEKGQAICCPKCNGIGFVD